MSKEKNKSKKSVLTTLRLAVNNLFAHKEILYPFAFIAFIQLLVLEILYFYPRFPLNKFFGPLVTRLWSADYMHYPYNIGLLPKLFQSMQIPLYVIFNSFFLGVAVAIIVAINNNQKVTLKKIYRETWGSYVHLVVASLLMFLAILGIFKLYGLVFERALLIRSTAGLNFWLKTMVIKGAPYFQFLISVFVTTIFAYVIPIIVIDRRNVFYALWRNFMIMLRSFFFTLFVIIIPSLLYVLIMLIRVVLVDKLPAPEWGILLLVANIFVLILIDAITYTAISTVYLLQKENQ